MMLLFLLDYIDLLIRCFSLFMGLCLNNWLVYDLNLSAVCDYWICVGYLCWVSWWVYFVIVVFEIGDLGV